MKTLERTYTYSVKQYQKEGFGHKYYFIDTYFNSRIEQSVMLLEPLSDNELERFFNVFIERRNKGENAEFYDSTERRMVQLFDRNVLYLSEIERMLKSKMGADKFLKHYESKCYYLAWIPDGTDCEAHQTFHLSPYYTPLVCLKDAYQMGEKIGKKFRILLSDGVTEVDPELLAFALSEV